MNDPDDKIKKEKIGKGKNIKKKNNKRVEAPTHTICPVCGAVILAGEEVCATCGASPKKEPEQKEDQEIKKETKQETKQEIKTEPEIEHRAIYGQKLDTFADSREDRAPVRSARDTEDPPARSSTPWKAYRPESVGHRAWVLRTITIGLALAVVLGAWAFFNTGAEIEPERSVEVAQGKMTVPLDLKKNAASDDETGSDVAEQNPSILLARARLALSRSDDVAAAGFYERYIASRPDDAEGLLEAGRSMMRPGMYRVALDSFEQAADLLPSDDKRGIHSINAAKNMLGWPTDEGMVITPAVSIGNMTLGMTQDEALSAWGKPIYSVDEDEYSVWGYGATSKESDTVVYFDSDGVIEIVTESSRHATRDGLSLKNFSQEKYADRFIIERDAESGMLRYTLKEGGLAFYYTEDKKGEAPRAVIYGGLFPLTERGDAEWGEEK